MRLGWCESCTPHLGHHAHHDRALNELALAEVRSPPRSISISLFRIRRVAISHPWRAIKASREVAGQVPPSIRRPGRRSSSDEVEFSFGQLASVVHGVHCDLPSTGEWPIQSPCEHIGSALAADPVNPFTDSAQIRHFVMAITRSRTLGIPIPESALCERRAATRRRSAQLF